MASSIDSSAFSGSMALGLRAQSMTTVSTLLNCCVLIAALAVINGNKAADIFGTGVPDAGAILSGQELSPAKTREILECDAYYPLERSSYQSDLRIMGLRDTNPKMSTTSGTGTVTLGIAAGVITGGTVTSGGTWAGEVPDILISDPSGGQGAIVRIASIAAAGTLTPALTIVSGGYGYSTNSTGTVLSNLSAGEKYQRPCFRWTQMKSTGRVFEHDHDRARALAGGNEDYFHQKINDIYTDDQKEKVGLQIKRMEEDCIFGLPTNVNTTTFSASNILWNAPYGLVYMADDGTKNAVYAGVDRTIAGNEYFRAVYDTAAHVFTLVDLWQDAHISKGRIRNGGTIDAFFVSGTLFNKWQRESLAYLMNVNTDPMVQQVRANFGYKMPILKFSNSYIFLEPMLPPGTVIGLNMKTVILAFKQGKKWSIEGPFAQNAVEGGIDGNIYYVNTQYMLINEAPNFGCVQYTAVS